MPVRALVVSADVGESHAQMAGALVRELEARDDVAEVSLLNGFEILGPLLGAVLGRGFRFHLQEVKWSYDLTYRLFSRMSFARRLGELALARLGGPWLARAIDRHLPDVVVSTYPVMNPVLASLRRRGRLKAPAAAVVGPIGGHDFWAQSHLDLHLLLYPEARPSVERLSGPVAMQAVRPLVDPQFYAPRPQAEAREAVGAPASGPLVLISGGGWGLGDLAGAIEAALAAAAAHVVVVTGRNEVLQRELSTALAGDPRVSVLGFTAQMRDFLCAADAFVTTTAGISCLESLLCGCPAVCYGFPVGHVRDNVRALAAHGYARAAGTSEQLQQELSATLRSGRLAPSSLNELPSAAEVTVQLARRGAGATVAAEPAGQGRPGFATATSG